MRPCSISASTPPTFQRPRPTSARYEAFQIWLATRCSSRSPAPNGGTRRCRRTFAPIYGRRDGCGLRGEGKVNKPDAQIVKTASRASTLESHSILESSFSVVSPLSQIPCEQALLRTRLNSNVSNGLFDHQEWHRTLRLLVGAAHKWTQERKNEHEREAA